MPVISATNVLKRLNRLLNPPERHIPAQAWLPHRQPTGRRSKRFRGDNRGQFYRVRIDQQGEEILTLKDLEALARSLGVLAPEETVEDEKEKKAA